MGLRGNLLPPLLALPLLGPAVPPAPVQEEPPVELRVSPESGTATLRIGGLLQEGALRSALQAGLPLRIRVVTELWRDRFLDSQEGRAEWRASIAYDPLERAYRVQAGGSPVLDLTVASLGAAGDVLRQNFQVPLRPRRPGRYYYLATLEVGTLSLSDLQELQRWLRGDLAPAVSGERDVESAVARGVRRMFVRVLGLPARRFQLRTAPFDFPPDTPEGA